MAAQAVLILSQTLRHNQPFSIPKIGTTRTADGKKARNNREFSLRFARRGLSFHSTDMSDEIKEILVPWGTSLYGLSVPDTFRGLSLRNELLLIPRLNHIHYDKNADHEVERGFRHRLNLVREQMQMGEVRSFGH